MIVNLSLDQIRTVDQMRAFVEGADRAEITHLDRDGAYALITVAVERVLYPRLGRADKGTVLRFLEKATGLSRAQIDRLVRQHRRTGHIRDHRNKPPARPFPRRYTPADIALLAEVDEAYGQLSGPATKEILRRMYELHGDERFRRLASISNGHIYNLGKTRSYRRGRLTFHQTRSTPVRIGQRRKPTPDGSPGHLRVDTVHLGDREGNKGIYVINVVDEVTQFQHLGAVPNITESYLIPLLEALITALPFTVEALHADNGSEYVNHRVVELLNKLRIGTFTKSRPRRTNDNALVESKNGSIVRKWLGHTYVPGPLAPRVDAFLRDTPSPPSSTSTGPACSPSTSSAPPAVSKSAIPRPRSPPPTTACAASPTPSDSSDRMSPSRPSTSSPSQPRASRQPRVSSAPATSSCAPSQTRPAGSAA